ncbi:MAG: AAA family ATPase [Streptococcus agalactiae]|nr:AAA family ATPase [Streptococcus agalactiae]
MFDNGCEWIRCDFHLHTRKDKEFKYTGEDNSFVSDYVNKLKSEKIKIGVITNHNKFDLQEYKALKKAANKKDIFILPGVELSVKDGKNGVHTLIVFNPEDWIKNGENHIESFLTAAFQGVSNRENENTCCNFDINTLLVELEKLNKDYFIVFAHIEQRSGLIEECGGGRLSSLAQNHEFKKRVLGLQKLRTFDNKSKIKDWFGYEIAFVEGSDPKNISEIGKGETSFIKIGEYSFAAVKFALQDYESRVLRDLPICNHGYVKSASFKGGRLDSVKIPFSNELNSLIGIRGSGKSSILETIRYALNLNADIDSDYKNDLVKNTLGSGGEISLEVIDEYGKKYEVKRLMGEQPSVIDSDGKDVGISINSLINNPLYFGQKDLSFTKSGYAFELLQKLVGGKIKDDLELKEENLNGLENSIKEFLQLETIPEKVKELKTTQQDLEHRLKVFEEKGIAEKLKKQTSYSKDDSTIKTLLDNVKATYEKLSATYKEIDKTEFGISDYKSEYNTELFQKIELILKDIVESFEKINCEIENVSTKELKLKELRIELENEIDSLKGEFANIKREINDEELDPDSYVKYNSELEKTVADIDKFTKRNNSRNSLSTEIRGFARKRNKMLNDIFNKYKNEIRKINESQGELKIKILFKGDKEKFKQDIKTKFKGTGLTDNKTTEISKQYSDFTDIIIDCVLEDSKRLRGIITDNEVVKVYNKIKENYSNLIREECPDLVEIFYHDKLLEKHSIGQRASALILFILTQEENDLIIIDQPEDDLDNQIIYQEVISTIKKKKSSIQFIFATHNANIPVLGDSESVISTEYDEKINADCGNIDCISTHQKIVDIMEGGKEAFERRKLIYTNWHDAIQS